MTRKYLYETYVKETPYDNICIQKEHKQQLKWPKIQ